MAKKIKQEDSKKKKFHYNMLALIIVILLIAIYLLMQPRFDPAKHVCLEYQCSYLTPFAKTSPAFTTTQINQSKCPDYNGLYCLNETCTPLPIAAELCIKWRNKNPCELNKEGYVWKEECQCGHNNVKIELPLNNDYISISLSTNYTDKCFFLDCKKSCVKQ